MSLQSEELESFLSDGFQLVLIKTFLTAESMVAYHRVLCSVPSSGSTEHICHNADDGLMYI